MIAPRVLFQGDLAEAVKYVGIAKKFARSTFDAGIISKVWRISDGVSIRVANNIQAKVCKVWIEAEAGGGYQFYTTSPHPQWATWENPDTDFFPGGSGVYVPYPAVKIVDGVADFSQAKIKAYPTGSTVEVPPIIDGKPLWKYTPTPGWLFDLNNLMQGEMLKVKNAWQVNGFPEGRWYQKTITQEEIDKGVITQPKKSLYHSFVQGGGQVHGCGAFQPIAYKYFTDFFYDTEPASMPIGVKRLNGKAPDTDWFGEACLQVAGNPEFGYRQFIILTDTSGKWYCYPVAAGQDVGRYAAMYVSYGSQAYKASVIPEQAKSYIPAYPEWVAPFESWRDLKKNDANLVIFELRYSWVFNSVGTKAISVMIERKVTEAGFKKTQYYYSSLPESAYDIPLLPPVLPQEITIPPLEIDRSLMNDGSSDAKSIFIDRRGYVELEFLIEVTGNNIEDFTFSVGVTSSQSPDVLEALDKGSLVSIAYAKPLYWGIEESEAFGRSLTKNSYRTNDVVVDDILTVWLELYRHTDQIDMVNMYDGEFAINVPTKTKARFCKNYPPSQIELFCVPLSQSHGAGYTYSDDPDNPPATPHEFVYNTNRSLSSILPWLPKNGTSAALYYYNTRLTCLDLGSLSFYCETRVLKQRRDSSGSPMNYTVNAEKKYCGVCVMGKVIDEYFVGCSDIPDSWVRGWVYEAGYADLDDGEEIIPLNFNHNLCATGQLSGGRYPGRLYSVSNGDRHWANGVVTTNSYVNDMFTAVGVSDRDALEMVTSDPWWAIGPCGHMFGLALSLALVVQLAGSSFTYTVFEDQDPPFSVEFNFNYSLDSITGDMAGFLGGVYDLYETLSITSNGGEPQRLSSIYSENPFVLANPGMTKSKFIESLNTQHMRDFIEAMADLYRNVGRDPAYHETHGHFLGMLHGTFATISSVLPITNAFFALARGGGIIRGFPLSPGYNSFTELGGGNYINFTRHRYKLENFELGNMYYNEAIIGCFTVNEMEFNDGILVTPEGHISYSKKNFFALDKEFCTSRVFYDGRSYGTNFSVGYGIFLDLSSETDKLPRFYCMEASGVASNPYNCAANNFSWESVDGLSWHYNKVRTKHIYVYNLAYQKIKDGRKEYLVSDEQYFENYNNEYFKPAFEMFTYNKYRWFYPFKMDDGLPYTLTNLSVSVDDAQHYTSPLAFPRGDPRPNKTFLRLSPLFF